MADSISVTPPKSEWLLKLSQLLRTGAEKVKPYERIDPNNEDTSLPIVSGLLDSLSKGTEGWAYGDSPIDTRANTPLVNERTLDMAGALPIGSAAKVAGVTKAALIPALPHFIAKGDSLRALNLQKEIETADRLQKLGAPLGEVQQRTGLHLQPGTIGDLSPNNKAKWAFRTEPGFFDQSISADHASKITDVLEDPELFSLLPQLKDVGYVSEKYAGRPLSKNARAHFDSTIGPHGEIVIGDIARTGDQLDLIRTNHHELDHAINRLMGQTGATGSSYFPISEEGLAKLPGMIKHLEQVPGAEEIVKQLRQVDRSIDPKVQASKNWSKSAGEWNAELAGNLAKDEFRTGNRLQLLPDMPEGLVADNLMRSLGDVLYNQKMVKEQSPEMLGELLAALLRRDKGGKPGVAKQLILPERLRDKSLSDLNESLIVSHSAKPLRGTSGALPRELYNPSLGITKDKLINFGSNETTLIGNPGKFDPATEGTTLFGTDAWTPRRHQTTGNSVDTHARHQADTSDFYQKIGKVGGETEAQALVAELRANANARLADKFISTYTQGGLGAESLAKPTVSELRKYGFDPQLTHPHTFSRTEGNQGTWNVGNAKRFQSFEEYLRSPRGAGRLSAKPAHTSEQQLEEALAGYGDEWGTTPRATLAKMLGKDSELHDPTEFYDIIKALRTGKSDYGELKAWGPVQVNRENFAGIIDHKFAGNRSLENQAKQLGIPYHKANSNNDAYTAAKQMQVGGYKTERGYVSMNTGEHPGWAEHFDDATKAQMKDWDWAAHGLSDKDHELAPKALLAKLNNPKSTPLDLTGPEEDFLFAKIPGHTMSKLNESWGGSAAEKSLAKKLVELKGTPMPASLSPTILDDPGLTLGHLSPHESVWIQANMPHHPALGKSKPDALPQLTAEQIEALDGPAFAKWLKEGPPPIFKK